MLGTHAMSHDDDHYHGVDFDDNVFDHHGGFPRHPRWDFFDRHDAGHGGHHGGGV